MLRGFNTFRAYFQFQLVGKQNDQLVQSTYPLSICLHMYSTLYPVSTGLIPPQSAQNRVGN
jgi:hypothetical protein